MAFHCKWLFLLTTFASSPHLFGSSSINQGYSIPIMKRVDRANNLHGALNQTIENEDKASPLSPELYLKNRQQHPDAKDIFDETIAKLGFDSGNLDRPSRKNHTFLIHQLKFPKPFTYEILHREISYRAIDLFKKDPLGKTRLHLLFERGRIEEGVAFLKMIAEKKDLHDFTISDLRDQSGNTLLHAMFSPSLHRLGITKLNYDRAADTPLQALLKAKKEEHLTTLYQQAIDLMHAIDFKAHSEMFHIPNAKGYTPLHQAAANGNFLATKIILNSKRVPWNQKTQSFIVKVDEDDEIHSFKRCDTFLQVAEEHGKHSYLQKVRTELSHLLEDELIFFMED